MNLPALAADEEKVRALLSAISARPSRSPRLRQIGLMLMFCLWASSVLGAVLWQQRYAATAGAPAVAPMNWPGGSTLPFHPGRFNLLVFLHPQCPCSHATVAELARLVAQAGPRMETRVMVLEYGTQSVPSTAGPLYRQAAAIPGVVLRVDQGGALARRFQAACSGQTLLYDPTGRLVFSGGITFARGHEGDNDGEAAVLRLVVAPGVAADPPPPRPPRCSAARCSVTPPPCSTRNRRAIDDLTPAHHWNQTGRSVLPRADARRAGPDPRRFAAKLGRSPLRRAARRRPSPHRSALRGADHVPVDRGALCRGGADAPHLGGPAQQHPPARVAGAVRRGRDQPAADRAGACGSPARRSRGTPSASARP